VQYSEQTNSFEQFFREFMKEEIGRAASKGARSLPINFNELSKHSPELADYLLEHPDESLDAASDAVEKLSFVDKELTPRITNLPENEFVNIRNLRSHHIGSVVGVKGLIKRASEVRPEIVSAVFECNNCGDTYEKEQDSSNLKTPYKCSCGNRNFELIDKKLVDVQIVTIEEDPEQLQGAEHPRKIGVYLRDDLVDPEFQNRVVPGNKVLLSGVLRERAQKKDSKRFDIYIEGNYLEPIQREFEEIEITPEREEEIHELANRDNVFEEIIDSIAPSIHGHRQIKKAIALQLFAGVRKERPDGTSTRGDMHMLLIGEPGTGKSQLLKFTGTLAPKGKYVVGKAATAAGITATVMKDEITDEWTLEAGALVLANNGIATVDEIDKMAKDDRSSMHEAMEQQCFGPDTRVTLADGTVTPISNIVDPVIENNPDTVSQSDGREVTRLGDEDLRVMATDMEGGSTSAQSVSVVGRRKAPEKMLRITLENGREIEVTSEHPFYQLEGGSIMEHEARNLDKDCLIAAPADIPVEGREQTFEHIRTRPRQKEIDLPTSNGPSICRFAGYQVSDGGYELNRGRKCGVNFTNTDDTLVEDYTDTVEHLFGIEPYIRERYNRKAVRVISRQLVAWLEELDPAIIEKGTDKKLPDILMNCQTDDLRHLLRAFFDGDGGVYSTQRGYRIRAVVENRELLKQIQDLLMRFGVHSSLQQDGNVWRLDISRHSDMKRFDEQIGFLAEAKSRKLDRALEQERDAKTPVPGVAGRLTDLIQLLGRDQQDLLDINLTREQNISKKRALFIIRALQERVEELERVSLDDDIGHLASVRRRFQIPMREVAENIGVSTSLIGYWERNGTSRVSEYRHGLERSIKKRRDVKDELCRLRQQVENIRWLRIRNIEEFKPEYTYVYDLTVPTTNSFVAENVVGHNSITVSKANIQATLQCKTSILAAGNPKFGRFDPYQPVAEQIDISDTLLSRFDLIFPVRDLPERSKDKKLADHIMKMHTQPEEHTGTIEKELLRDYIAYAKRNVSPKITDEAEEELKKFYVNTREEGSSDGQSKVPITARQLEALIRLAEASAKTRLSETVERKDSQMAIDLLTYSLKQIGVIDESGNWDIDKKETGISTENRNNIQVIMQIIQEEGAGEAVPIEDVMARAEEEGIDESSAEEIINNLKKEGELYEPKQGHVGKI